MVFVSQTKDSDTKAIVPNTKTMVPDTKTMVGDDR
jgi:hypothetical protein